MRGAQNVTPGTSASARQLLEEGRDWSPGVAKGGEEREHGTSPADAMVPGIGVGSIRLLLPTH